MRAGAFILAGALAVQSLQARAAEFVSTNDHKLFGDIIRFTESTVTIRPEGGSMIMLAPDDIKLVRYTLNDGSTIEGTLHDWRDGTYVLEAVEQLISARDGAILSEKPLAPPSTEEDSGAADEIATGESPPDADNSDQNGRLEIAATADVASEQSEELVIDISSSRPWKDEIIILFATLDGTAKAGSDFESKNGVVRLPAGETEVQLAIPLIDDDEAEGDEQLTLFLSSSADIATLSQRKVIATIRDDD